MPQSDPLQILLSHDRWATEKMLDECGKLTAEQFHRRFEMGRGSLHDTLTHMIAAIRTWNDTLALRDMRPRLETDGQQRTPEQLRPLLEEAIAELQTEAHRRPLDEMVSRQMRDGKKVTLTRGAVVAHVTTHGMHHRAQCLNMLRQVGTKSLPPSSVAEWAWLSDRDVSLVAAQSARRLWSQ